MIRLTFCVGLPPTSCWGMISRGAWTLCPDCCWGAPWRSAFTLISCTFPPVGNIVDGLPTIAGCTAPLITWLVVFPTVTTPRTKKERILYYLYLYDIPQQNNYLKHLAIFFSSQIQSQSRNFDSWDKFPPLWLVQIKMLYTYWHTWWLIFRDLKFRVIPRLFQIFFNTF